MKIPVFRALLAVGFLLPALSAKADDCAGTRSAPNCAGNRSSTRTYRSVVRSSPRTYYRTTPVYANVELTPVRSTGLRSSYVEVDDYDYVDYVDYDYVETVPRSTRVFRSLSDNDRLTNDCGGSTRSAETEMRSLLSVIQTAKTIGDLFCSHQSGASAKVDEDEIYERLKPRIEKLINEKLEAAGVKPGNSGSAREADRPKKPKDNDRITADLRSEKIRSLADDPVIKNIKAELETAKTDRERMNKSLDAIVKHLKIEVPE